MNGSKQRTARYAATVALLTAGLVGGFVAGPAIASDETESSATPVATARSTAIPLDEKQEEALREAWRADGELTTEEVLNVVGEEAVPTPDIVTGNAAAAPDGPAEGEGWTELDCSVMTLWGDENGEYFWTNDFFPRKAGPALFGTARISALEGELSVPSYVGVEGYQQLEEGTIPFTGFGAVGTSVRAASVNERPFDGEVTACLGVLPVWWE